MRSKRVILASTIFVALATAEGSNTDAISELRKTHPTVKWNSTPTLVADVFCDGKPDTVILGSEKNSVVVGVVSSVRPHNTQVLSFPIGSATQDGFCAFPVRIETSPLKCEADVGTLPGCKPTKGCQSFTVIDDECDSFNFYWDSSRRSLAWWRH